MKLKILWMYHDLMDLYGDKGNIEVLRRRAEKRGIECVVDTCTLNEEKKISDYDLFFLGGGADREQQLIYKDLLGRRAGIQEAMDSGTAFLLICDFIIRTLTFQRFIIGKEIQLFRLLNWNLILRNYISCYDSHTADKQRRIYNLVI